MQATFPMRTGDIAYHMSIASPSTTGSWSVSLGFLDQNENLWSVSGASGKIYDNSGYMVGGYNPWTETVLKGVISGGGHSIYQDDVLLSNTQNQEEGDYNMISISGGYVQGYNWGPRVVILGDWVVNDHSYQTVPFWKKRNDDKVLFVTENADADLGFIRAISGMGFSFIVEDLTGSGVIDVEKTDENYGLVIFGSATSSGLYTSGGWNSLSMPMMSLNSSLVCPENLNWYGFSGVTSVSSGAYQTGVVFPQQYRSPENAAMFWAEWPTLGWLKMYRISSFGGAECYSTEGVYGVPSTLQVCFYNDLIVPISETQVVMKVFKGSSLGIPLQHTSAYFVGDVRPSAVGGFPDDLELTFTDIEGGPTAGVTIKLSNTLGGTGAPSASFTGTTWGLDQIHNLGRVVPQTASYNVDNLYRRTTLTSGLYPTDQFNMYTGDFSVTQAAGGDTLVANIIPEDTFTSMETTGKVITVWHKGFWTGGLVRGGYTEKELMSFSVTPTGNDWATGYNMWDTLTQTGKQLFVNAVAGFFID